MQRWIVVFPLAVVGALACSAGSHSGARDATAAAPTDAQAGLDVPRSSGPVVAIEQAPRLKQVTQSLVRAMVCAGGQPLDAFWALALVAAANPDAAGELACAASAPTCDAFWACRKGVQRTEETCDSKSFVGTCEGAIGTRCESGRVIRRDCTLAPSGNTRCLVVGGDTQCVADTSCTQSECRGESLDLCLGGKAVVRGPCSTYGVSCVVEDGVAACGASCPAPRCDGTVAVSCDDPESVEQGDADDKDAVRQASIDCRTFSPDYTCVMRGGQVACTVETPTCDTSSDAFCDGDRLLVCNLGAWIAFDCGAFQGSTCRTYDGHLFDEKAGCAPRAP